MRVPAADIMPSAALSSAFGLVVFVTVVNVILVLCRYVKSRSVDCV
jgi:hypothetical protein